MYAVVKLSLLVVFSSLAHADVKKAAIKMDMQECLRSCDHDKGDCQYSRLSGWFTCVCKSGYKLSDDGITCTKIDYCNSGLDDCDRENGECYNTEKSFNCYCKSGYTGNGKTCTEVEW